MTTEQTTGPNPRCDKCGRVLMALNKQYAICPANAEPGEEVHGRLIQLTPELERVIKVASLPQAIPLKGIRATEVRNQLDCLPAGAETCGVEIYYFNERPGLWRRVSKSIREARGHGGSLLLAATPDGQIWQFVLWESMAKELRAVLGCGEEDAEDG